MQIPSTLLPWIKKTLPDLDRFEELAAHFESDGIYSRDEAELLAWIELLRAERCKKTTSSP